MFITVRSHKREREEMTRTTIETKFKTFIMETRVEKEKRERQTKSKK